MHWFKCFILNNTVTVHLKGLYLECQTSDGLPNTLPLLSVTCHCILLDVVFTSKTHKPLTDQGLEGTLPHNGKGSIPLIIPILKF